MPAHSRQSENGRSFNFDRWNSANWSVLGFIGKAKYLLRFSESFEFELAKRDDLRSAESRDLRRHNGSSAHPAGKGLEPRRQIDRRTNGREIEPVRTPDISVGEI